MSSPFIPCPFQYNDIPGGGQQAILVVSSVAPTVSQTQQGPGTFWLVPSPLGSGNLYFLSGFLLGVPQWELIGTASGDITSVLGTASEITATTASGGVVTLSIPAGFVAPGSITAASGAITATNGNLVLGTAGNKIISTSVGTTTAAGANSIGSVALVSGTATVATTAITATSLVFLTRESVAGSTALGQISLGTVVAGTSFVIYAATQASPGTPLATDASVVAYMIVN